MSSSSANSFDHFSAASAAATGIDSFNDGYSFPNFDSNVADFPPSVYVSGGEFVSDPAYLSSETNEDGPILPPPVEMEHEECYAVREWRRQNTIRIEEKEKKEKKLLSRIIELADEYKVEFNRKRVASCETNKVTNREKEQVFVAIQEKFHAEAGKDYWKSIAEIIPKELPTIEKRKDTKEQAKKASSVTVIQGPKPGKPSDLSRMRQILLNLKHNTPPHLKQLDEAGNTEAVAVA